MGFGIRPVPTDREGSKGFLFWLVYGHHGKGCTEIFLNRIFVNLA